MLHQFGRPLAMIGIKSRADACAAIDIASGKTERLLQRIENRGAMRHQFLLGGDLGKQHGEFVAADAGDRRRRSEEHTSELQSLMRISYAVFCLKKKKQPQKQKRNK